MTTTALVVLIYGVLVLAGGVMGYMKAQSMASLVAGGISGLLLIGAALLMTRGSYGLGWWAALIISVLLLARFAVASLSNFKVMPGGLMILLSLVTIIVLLTAGRGQLTR